MFIKKHTKPYYIRLCYHSIVSNIVFLLRSNVPKKNRKSYLKNCMYDETVRPYCPIFRLGDIVNKTGHTFEEMALRVRIVDVVLIVRPNLI